MRYYQPKGQHCWILAGFFKRKQTKLRSIKMQRKNEANIQPTSQHVWSLKDLLYRLESYFSLGDQSEKSRAGNIKAHLARTTSQSEHRMRFILATCGTSHIIIVFLVRKQIVFSVGQSEPCKDLSRIIQTGASEEIA